MPERDNEEPRPIGDAMYEWARDLFPINRSLTGPGVRETLNYLARLVPELEVLEVPSGTSAFDWIVPPEWTIRDAWIEDEAGIRVVDFRRNNLHVVGYSVAVDAWLTRAELDVHLHSLPDQPNAIPYITSYYASYWGFCLSHEQRATLTDARYRVVIDSDLAPGVMNIGEAIIRGSEDSEILLSCNICHPSLANNEVSGMVVVSALACWLTSLPNRRHTYRLLFLPETIGSVWYLSRHAEQLKQKVIAGFVVTCVGDDRAYSYVPSRAGNTLADRIALRALSARRHQFTRYSYLERGSDERQYCSPGIDLPVCSVMRSKYGTYPEYHTSLDDLSLISPRGLQGAYEVLRDCLGMIEENLVYRTTVSCEPQLGKRGLYPNLSEKTQPESARNILNVLAYADGTRDLFDIADAIGVDETRCSEIIDVLLAAGLVEVSTNRR